MVVETCKIVDQVDSKSACSRDELSIGFEKPRYEIEYYPVELTESAREEEEEEESALHKVHPLLERL